MSKSEDPPAYSRSSTELEPPTYSTALPASLHVGKQDTSPVVGLEEVEAHLRILGAFGALKSRVTAAQKTLPVDQRLQPADAWTVFLCRAVYRFELWISNLPAAAITVWKVLPPIDVLLVWHTYLLNPLTYEDDAKRKLSALKTLDMFPLLEIASLIDAASLEMNSPEVARDSFERMTGTSYNPPLATRREEQLKINCPCCVGESEFEWPWIKEDGTGWSQRGFQAQCPTCNHAAFGVKKFCVDLATWRAAKQAPANDISSGMPFGFAGATTDERRAELVSFCDKILKDISDGANEARLVSRWNWKFSSLEKDIVGRQGYSVGTFRYNQILAELHRFLAKYRFPGPFSIELPSAIMRQGTFIDKMIAMGWTSPQRFESDKGVLLRAIARYHAFLDLMAASPSVLLVPTLDIDLAWHTHQLKARDYHKDTIKLLGFTPDHDDSVEDTVLGDSLEITAQAWLRRFGVPYTICGCLVTLPDANISRTFRGLKSRFSGSAGKRAVSVPPEPKNPRPDLLTGADDGSPNATHPSDHNGIRVLNDANIELKRQDQRKHFAAIQEKRQHDVERGRAEEWTEIQHYFGTRDVEGEKKHLGQAFYHPIKFWNVSPHSYGHFGCEGAMCGAGGGATVDGSGPLVGGVYMSASNGVLTSGFGSSCRMMKGVTTRMVASTGWGDAGLGRGGCQGGGCRGSGGGGV